MTAYKAAVITMSDKGSRGERVDTAGPLCEELLRDHDWDVVYHNIIPDDYDTICRELVKCADELQVTLVVTTGGTGFSPRDVTPEATLAVCDREVRGLPEAMRAASMKITPMGMLSRAAAGLRGRTLILNVPGSAKAAGENLEAVIKPLRHGVEVLLDVSHDCAELHTHDPSPLQDRLDGTRTAAEKASTDGETSKK
ncbi:MAG: MogA/MoaB family molybdenum cofactor biosynthesis protein [Anaerovoracaceae bacterium]|jgi:molybdopterin adenylyltransferase